MNCGSPEMLGSGNMDSDNTEMTVLERQHSRQKWPQEEPVSEFFNENGVFPASLSGDQGIGEMLMGAAMKPDPEIGNGWNNEYRRILNFANGSEFEMGYGIPPPRSLGSPPNAAAVNKGKEVVQSSAAAVVAGKKRKAEKTQILKLQPIPEEKSEEKKKKASVGEDSKLTEQNSNSNSKSSTTTASTTTNNKTAKGPSVNNKRPAEVPKPDYIHVRARRGQATDSHSLAERVRREKISERMKYLQDLVPGCNKITGKAGMLDEIINYVQSLQRQVEFLSMKLATVNPRLDLDIDNYLVKEVFPAMTSNVPAIGTSSDMVNLQYTALGHGILGSNLELVGNNPMDHTLRRTTSAPVHNFLDSPNVNQIQQQLTWEEELQNLYSMEYQQGRPTPFISQPFTGFLESGNVKTEM